MMKKAILFLVGFPFYALGQTTEATRVVSNEQSRVNAMNNVMQNNNSSQMLYYGGSELDVKGSKYFYYTYVQGEILLTNGQVIKEGYLFKFDEEENSVQVKDKTGQETLVNAATIASCQLTIEGKSVFYLRATVPTDLNKIRTFQLLFGSNAYRAIKLPSKKLIPKTKIFHDDPQQYEYISEHRYFLKKGEGKFEEIKLKKNDLLKAFPEKKATLTKLFNTPQYKERLTEALLAKLLGELEKAQ